MSKDNRNMKNQPPNVVDIDQLRSRRERRKAQQKSLLGTLRGEAKPGSEPKGKPSPQTGRPPKEAVRPPAGGQNYGKDKPAPPTKAGPPRGVIGALVVACIVLAAAVMVALGMNLFVVNTIEVIGGVHFNRAQILEATGVRQGQSIFSVNAGAIRTKLQNTPQLQLESLERSLPGKIILTVKETTPTLVATYMNQYITLDQELRTLSQEGAIPEGDYPLVTGMVVRNAPTAEKIEVDDKLQMEALEGIVAAFAARSDSADDQTYAPLYYITEIQLSDVDNLKLFTQNGYIVELGDSQNLDRKALWVEQMVPVFIEKGYTGGTLDVSGSNSATFIPAQGQGTTTTPATEPQTP